MRKFLLFILLSGFTFFISKNVSAQGVTTASVNGIVSDAKGPIPGATVTITHVPTGTVYSTVTRTDGRFNLTNLRVGGPYSFKVTFIGYKDFAQDDLTLSIGQDQKIDARLVDNTTALNEVVVRGTAGKVINSSRTGARETISRQQIEALPTLNRSLSDFTKLTPSANGLSFGGRSSLFNNITVDGALFNNSFGLSGTLGGQTNSQPISLDAIDQIQVDIAPYDVRQGNFTGAGVNTVVKSGTNTFKGTVYDYIRSVGLTGYSAGTANIKKVPFTYHTDGVSIGGPIIKNKLFFFLSGEQERLSNPYSAFVAAPAPGQGGTGNVSQADAQTLNAIAAKLAGYGYNPGPYQGYNFLTSSDKITAKIDWNIDKNNTLSAKYFYLKSYRDNPPSNSNSGTNSFSRGASSTTLPFYGAGYRINNNFNIGIVELDTRFSSKISNKLTVGYSALRDFRTFLGSGGSIPFVDIGNGGYANDGSVINANATLTSFGSELFTAGNLLSTNIAQFSDDLTIFAGKHELTFGTSNQIQSYTNGFAPNYNGIYIFNSAYDFLHDLPANQYATRNSALPDGSFPFAKIKAGIYSVYAQDKVHITDNFRLTYGVRADYDAFPTTLQANPNVTDITFQQGIQVNPSVLPDNRVQISPRVGFNWDVYGDGSTQVRGGSGLFSGSIPFVWISNQASNNGVLFGSYTVSKSSAPNDPRLIFNPNPNANRPAPGAAAANTSYELDVADPKLKYPKIWRTNLAVDQKLPWGIIGTIEGAYSKDINAIYHENLVLSDSFTTLPGPEGQIQYTKSNNYIQGTPTAQNPSITSLYYMTNTSKGYSYFITAQLQKSFANGFYANIAYTHSGSKDVNDGGSTASTIWSSRATSGNPNGEYLSNSSFVQPNRIIASLAYKSHYSKTTATTLGLIFEMANNGAVSYTTTANSGKDLNNDGQTGNDLMWIPRTQSDIILVKDFAGDPRSAQDTWEQLNAFINQDKYLSSHRGQYAERNGVILPYFKRLDLHFAQDLYIKVGSTKNTLQFTADIINFGNLLNKNWGLYQDSYTGFNNGNTAVLKYQGLDAATGRPTYSFPYLNRSTLTPVTTSFVNEIGQISRYQVQLGFRYIFN
ncbi:MAG: TonB-dependent receptor [Mucilaginibacter sp.]|uniref:TonB-dependent receptor n=1 Tax=Mucilaginibacter sp. L3T2-6 TaxID=3062491 RepID=UPI0026766367|nr:TonB-dependent receptor [Mucilaginibacter sp. L3T2-6]MDO3641733.1 carboxypeptidase regulatory-like domain-containing protein [Mucilaginibacter sp. L3T2-6]MDV6214227.1 carboxypeptidase regulatory-like domain-containing protein [Mucilaginibacter sp. L3T2-6]